MVSTLCHFAITLLRCESWKQNSSLKEMLQICWWDVMEYRQCSALIQDELGSKFVDCKGAGTVFEKIFSRCCVLKKNLFCGLSSLPLSLGENNLLSQYACRYALPFCSRTVTRRELKITLDCITSHNDLDFLSLSFS